MQYAEYVDFSPCILNFHVFNGVCTYPKISFVGLSEILKNFLNSTLCLTTLNFIKRPSDFSFITEYFDPNAIELQILKY